MANARICSTGRIRALARFAASAKPRLRRALASPRRSAIRPQCFNLLPCCPRQPQRTCSYLHDRLAVGVHQGVGDGDTVPARSRSSLIDHLVGHGARRRRHLAAALSRLATPGTGSKTHFAASPTQPSRSRKIRSVCRQHSYMSVPGITWSSTKWQVRNQSSGWMSASARIRPRPNRPPCGSSVRRDRSGVSCRRAAGSAGR